MARAITIEELKAARAAMPRKFANLKRRSQIHSSE